ncbi:MAG: AAA family ATPase [Aliidiomarina sp.]|uniref:AAA family ATPase n=1 Tax=Aliidiomarina sp. TaxID=1872439 RepID=UPI0025C5D3CF|nr:AAA family ATPase [Aliidiomarina sp.]MCH8502164.1 AAA family ATPase [Aliidiomarina sp.]
MYHDYFGFSQVPFSIAPDPEFLFLGPRHREGLDHLRSGLSGSGGFLLLTGEVGTGKTTLSRAVMAEFGDKLKVAFVVNPLLSEREMLATVCDQFGIPGRHEKASLKRLTDHLSRFILTCSAEGCHPVILIDEAQHLLPSVLEQLRLLTNLETNSRKLLSIVLIGQPELQTLLQRRELRQVAQRIVARYHLLPLTEREAHDYIQHRLHRVSDVEINVTDVFTTSALKAIYQFSQGTPRLINLACDRALQMAARAQTKQVDRRLARDAIRSLSLEPMQSHRRVVGTRKRVGVASGLAVVSLLFAIVAWWQWLDQQSPEPVADHQSEQVRLDFAGLALPTALMALADLWQVTSFMDDEAPCTSIRDVRLACGQAQLTLDQVIAFDLPVVLKLIPGDDESTAADGNFLLLVGYQQDDRGSRMWRVVSRSGQQEMTEIDLRQYFPSDVVFLWQLPGQDSDRFLQSSLAERAPYSLKDESTEVHRRWLRRHLAAIARAEEHPEDALDAIELAYLSAAAFAQGPRLSHGGGSISGLSIDRIRHLAVEELSMLDIEPVTLALHGANESASANRNADVEGERLRPEAVDEELEYVSDRVRNLFDSVVAELGIDDVLPAEAPEQTAVNATEVHSLLTLQELTAEQRRRLPSFSYDSHMYSGRNQDRWVRFDGRMLREGEQFRELRIISIEPSHVVLGFDDFLFQLEALEHIHN